MVYLCKDPKGEIVFEPSSTADRKLSSFQTKSVSKTDHYDEVAALKQQLSELEKKLAEVVEAFDIFPGMQSSSAYSYSRLIRTQMTIRSKVKINLLQGEKKNIYAVELLQ